MAEETLVKDALTNDMISDGEALLFRLMETGLGITAVFWFYFSDLMRWQLVCGIEQVLTDGNLKIYTLIQEKLDERPLRNIEFADVIVLQADHPLVKRLKSLMSEHERENNTGFRVARVVVDNVLIEDAFIYRLPVRHRKVA